MVMPRYQRRGVAISAMPAVSTIGLQEAARTSQTLASAMDRMSSFVMKQAAQEAEVKGREYGALNAPTQQQIEDAVMSGKDVSEILPGDQSTIFGRAARTYALSGLSSEMEISARQSIGQYQTQYEKGQISLAQLELGIESVVSEHTDVLKRVSPLAAQQYSASMGVLGNSTYLDAAKKEAANQKNSFEIIASDDINTIIRNAETIIRAGDTTDESGVVTTIEQKIETQRQILKIRAEALGDVELYETKSKQLDEAVLNAKIGVVMDEVIKNPTKAFAVFNNKSTFEDKDVQRVFDRMSNQERRTLFTQIQDAETKRLGVLQAQESALERERVKQSEDLQSQFTKAFLGGADSREEARAILDNLKKVDLKAYESKLIVFETEAGMDSVSVVRELRQMSNNNQLTQENIDKQFSKGKLSIATYSTFMKDLENQRNQKYTRAISWLKGDRGLPDQVIANMSSIQRQADQEVAEVKNDLIEALEADPSINPLDFVKKKVQDIIREKGDIADRVLRQNAERTLSGIRTTQRNPNMTASEALELLEGPRGAVIIPRDMTRELKIRELKVLAEIEATNP